MQTDPDHVLNAVQLPPDAPTALRLKLGKQADASLRVAYVPGPGDVVGTFDHWRQGRHDPRVPVITYSGMFYSLTHALGAEALVITASETPPFPLDSRVTFRHVARRRGMRGLRYHLSEAAYARTVARVLNDWQPDITVVGSDAPPGLFRHLHSSTILSAHNTFWPMGQRPGGIRARVSLAPRAYSLRHVSTAICTSAECARQIVALGGDKPTFVQVPQVLSAEFPKVCVQPPTLPRRITYVGRMEANKGIFDLLRVFESLSAEFVGLYLTFAGNGSDHQRLAEAVTRSSCADQIGLSGRIDSRGIHALLENTDLLVCPTRSSFNEGLAMVVVEAAIHGRPSVISSVVPAIDLFPSGSLAFPADDTAALEQALRDLLTHPEKVQRLSACVLDERQKCLDRSRSWGSQLYRAMLACRR